MCSSGRLCGGGDQAPPSSASGGGSSSGSQYALCALGVGLVALGVVMIVWTVVPVDAAVNSSSSVPEDEQLDARGKTSSVAFVLVGAGVAMLLLAICLSVRSKRRQRRRETQRETSQYQDQVPGEPEEPEEDTAPRYDVPSYEEAVGSGQYPVRQSNLRQSTSQLPSYEDLLQAVENEGEGTGRVSGQEPPHTSPAPAAAATQPAPEEQPGPPGPPSRHSSRSSSRSSRILRPLRVRRIKSDKLHLKDFRLNIRNPTQGGQVTIEPLTPPPQYEDKAPEF